MAVFDIHLIEHDCEEGKFLKDGDFDRLYFDRSADILVGFGNKLLDNPVFEEKNRPDKADDQHEKCQ